MRKGWEYKKLEDCTQILDSQRKPVTKKDRKSGIYPYYGATGIQDYVDKYIFDGRYVLVGEDGAKWSSFTQSAFIIEGKTWVNNHAHVLRTNDFLVDSFLVYFLNYSDLDSYISGAIIRKLTQASLRNIDIPLPPKSTQLAIVSELDKINELIRLKKEQLKDFDNLAQSLFYEMFGDPVENEKGWEVKKLGEIGEFKNGLNFSKDENGHSIKFLGVSDFQNKKSIASDQLAYISLSERVQEDYLLKTGDIVFVRSNGKKELIGRSVKMYITEPTTYSGFCIRCRITDEKVDKDYIAILLKTPIIRQFMTNSGRGCNISNLNQKVLNSIPTILPPLPLQRLFALRIEQIEREKSEVQKSIQDLETLLASRMQYWFE